MSVFKTIKQHNAEVAIEKMFKGLEDDIQLKTVMRVLHGLDDESVLDELRRVREEDLKEIERTFELTDVTFPDKIEPEKKSQDIVNEPAEPTKDESKSAHD